MKQVFESPIIDNCNDIKYDDIMKNINQGEISLELFDTIDSTNTYAKGLDLSVGSGKVLVVAREQTAGRGKIGRSFYSPKSSGIYMSIALKQRFDIKNSGLVTMAVAVMVLRAIFDLTGEQLHIKWINDIIYNDKKIGGILVEAIVDDNIHTISGLVIGIGLNISTDQNDFPDDLREQAGSLKELKIDKNELIAKITNYIVEIGDKWYNDDIYNYYKLNSYILGKHIQVNDASGSYIAKAMDIDRRGALIVLCEGNETKTITFGEVINMDKKLRLSII